LELNISLGVAWDISPKAIECIHSNAKKYNVNANAKLIDVLKYKWEDQDEKFDIVFCNPPYILQDENERMGKNVLAHEPYVALFVEGSDPLIFYKTIIDNISHIIKASGAIYFETSDLYHEELESYLIERKLKHEFRKDMQGAWRMLKVSF
jgi:release factor glutamine methyltransferase